MAATISSFSGSATDARGLVYPASETQSTTSSSWRIPLSSFSEQADLIYNKFEGLHMHSYNRYGR